MNLVYGAALVLAGLYGNARANRLVRIRHVARTAHHRRLLDAGRLGDAVRVAQTDVPMTGPLAMSALSSVAVGGGAFLAIGTLMNLIAS